MLWLPHSYKPFPNSAQVENDTGTSNENEEEMHSLPFKVVGTCYSPARQKVLEEAYECLKPVFHQRILSREATFLFFLSSISFAWLQLKAQEQREKVTLREKIR